MHKAIFCPHHQHQLTQLANYNYQSQRAGAHTISLINHCQTLCHPNNQVSGLTLIRTVMIIIYC